MVSATRRVLVPIEWAGGRVRRGHLLPDLRSTPRTAFVRVPGGQDVSHGMVAFVGEAVTASDMLNRWESTIGRLDDRESALDHLEGYVRWIAGQTLGSGFEARYDGAGLLVARKVSDTVPGKRTPIPE